jgi:copper chaperone NosL
MLDGSTRLAAALAGILLACSGEPDSGPAAIIWDRDTCEHCMMAIGDRHHAAQVRDAKGRAHRFDDLGCALLWLDAQEASDPPLEIWVGSAATEVWIDARKASFVDGQETPMGYGFGAVPDGVLGLEEVRGRVRAREDARRSAGG